MKAVRPTIAGLAALLLAAASAQAAPPPPKSHVQKPKAAAAARPVPPAASDAQLYCANIADAAADARFAWQAQTLGELQQKIDAQLAALEAKRREYEEWLARRDAFLRQAEDGVVAIYAKMRPDAAAGQMATMQDEAAAALLAKLSARAASAILNEMDPARAARLTGAMTDTPPPPPAEEGEDAAS